MQGQQSGRSRQPSSSKKIWQSVVKDVQFWVPFAVLVVGLVLLTEAQ